MRDVEAVQLIDNLVTGGTVQVKLAVRILNNSRNERQRIANVARSRIGDRQNLLPAEALGGGGPGPVDRRRRSDDVHHLEKLLHVVHRHLEIRVLFDSNVFYHGSVETLLLDSNLTHS